MLRLSLPSLCAVCRQWGGGRLCGDCIARFAQPAPRCRRCARRVVAGVETCGACALHPPMLDRAIAAVDYEYPWDQLIARFKFRDGLDLAGALSERLSAAWRGAALPPATAPRWLVPVPLAEARWRERGYNQAWELARRVARRQGLRSAPAWLERWRDTPHQLALPLERRHANVNDAFDVTPEGRRALAGAEVWLLDDVMTTGATLHALAKAVREAGAASVNALVLARTEAA